MYFVQHIRNILMTFYDSLIKGSAVSRDWNIYLLPEILIHIYQAVGY